MGIGSKLSALLEKNNTNPNELAKNVGVAPTTIYSIIKRDSKKADIEVLLKIADILGVSVEYFVDDTASVSKDDNPVSSFDRHLLDKYHALDDHGKEIVDIVLEKEHERCMVAPAQSAPGRIIQYYHRLASAGNGQFVFDDLPANLIEIPDNPEYKDVKYAIGVNGSSMEPLYHDGDILLVKPAEDIPVGKIGIFLVDGQSYVKKRGKDKLISLNKEYNDILLGEDSQCLGEVVDRLYKI